LLNHKVRGLLSAKAAQRWLLVRPGERHGKGFGKCLLAPSINHGRPNPIRR
jgi:hypothetical protein